MTLERRTPIKRKSGKKRRTLTPRCAIQRCDKPAMIAGFCFTHAREKADREFQASVRERDGRCTAAGMFGLACSHGLQAAHVVGRRNYSVRYDPQNCHGACPAHHVFLDQHGREAAKYEWASRILGEDGWHALMLRARPMGDAHEAIRAQLEREAAA